MSLPNVASHLASLQRPSQYWYVESVPIPFVHHGLNHCLGNAKVAGMSQDLDLIGYRYNIAAAAFFVRIASHSFR